MYTIKISQLKIVILYPGIAKFDYDISNEQVIEIDKDDGFNWNKVIKDTLIYGTIGAVVGLIGTIIKKKIGKDDNFGF